MNVRYKSLLGQMAYVFISGLQLVFIPNVMLQLVGLPPTQEIWLRVMGVLVLALTFYYYAMARHGNDHVVRATVWGRLFFCTGLVLFVVLGYAQPPLIGFAVLETALALWTWQELRRSVSIA